MDIQEQAVDRKLLLRLSGELDHHGAKSAMRQLELALDTALPKLLVLDFADVSFMDSSGIALILRARQHMVSLEGELAVRGLRPQARRVLEAAGIDTLVRLQ